MTRKDYEAIATALRTELDANYYGDNATLNSAQKHAVRRSALRLSEVFADDNPRFDTERFLVAAGVRAERAPFEVVGSFEVDRETGGTIDAIHELHDALHTNPWDEPRPGQRAFEAVNSLAASVDAHLDDMGD